MLTESEAHVNKTILFQEKFLYFVNNTLNKSQSSIRNILLNHNGEFATANINFNELEVINQIANAVNPDESGQTLRNLVELTTEKFRKDDIHVSNYIRNGHLLSQNSVFVILKRKGVGWRLLTTPLDMLARL